MEVTIEIKGGLIVSVTGLPEDAQVVVVDWDNCPECGGVDPDCECQGWWK